MNGLVITVCLLGILSLVFECFWKFMLVGLLHEVEGPIMLVGFHIEDFMFSFFFFSGNSMPT